MDDKISVRKYERKRPSKPKAEKEDGKGIEFPAVAPQTGTKIITTPEDGKKRAHLNPRSSGVEVLGGGAPVQNGIRKGVTRLGGK